MSSTRLQCVFMLCASFAVAIDQPKPQKPECLSWDANGDWCSQSMDEPVVALQLSAQVHKTREDDGHLVCFATGVKADAELVAMIAASPKLKKIQQEMKMSPLAGYDHMDDLELRDFFFAVLRKLVPTCVPPAEQASWLQGLPENQGLEAFPGDKVRLLGMSKKYVDILTDESMLSTVSGRVEDTPLECFMKGIDEEPELVQMIQGSQKLQQIHEEMKANPMSGYKYMQDQDVKPFLDLAKVKLTQKCMGGQAMPAMGVPQTPMSCFTDGIANDPELSGMIASSPKLQQIQQEMKTNPMAGYQYMTDPEVKPFLSAAYIKLMPTCMAGGGAQGMALIGGQANMVVMNDPELVTMLEESPKLKQVMTEVQTNPLAGYKFMMDAEVLPFLGKAVASLIPNMGDTSVMFLNENSMSFMLLGDGSTNTGS